MTIEGPTHPSNLVSAPRWHQSMLMQIADRIMFAALIVAMLFISYVAVNLGLALNN